jgi:hypothetical protein
MVDQMTGVELERHCETLSDYCLGLGGSVKTHQLTKLCDYLHAVSVNVARLAQTLCSPEGAWQHVFFFDFSEGFN